MAPPTRWVAGTAVLVLAAAALEPASGYGGYGGYGGYEGIGGYSGYAGVDEYAGFDEYAGYGDTGGYSGYTGGYSGYTGYDGYAGYGDTGGYLGWGPPGRTLGRSQQGRFQQRRYQQGRYQQGRTARGEGGGDLSLDLSHIIRIPSSKPAPGPDPVETHLTGPNLILHFGYPSETHKVLTEDGYYVTMFRIPYSPKLRSSNDSRPVVFMQHGVLQTADQWLFRGPGRDLAFLLSDLGFDVWMGNFRGSTYSRKHVTLSPKKLRFWDFSWHENALFDLPAMLDYVGAVSGQASMYYVGHSMGTTTLLALLAERPEYNRRIRGAFLLAPVAYFTHTWGALAQARTVAPILTSQPSHRLIGEALPRGALKPCVAAVPLCTLLHNLGSGYSPGEYNATVFKILFGHYPSGASFGQLLHYGQLLVTGEFKMFDYGPRENLARYSQTTPPFYALSNVRAPIYLNYAEGDPLSPVKDVLRLAKEVPGVRKLMKVPLKDFGHVDHLYATHSYELEYKNIIDIMLGRNKYDN